jgi:serine/threonine protein kinase
MAVPVGSASPPKWTFLLVCGLLKIGMQKDFQPNFWTISKLSPFFGKEAFLNVMILATFLYIKFNNYQIIEEKKYLINICNIYLSFFSSDFGFAKHMFDGDKESVMKGSPLYMAPEIICSKSYDARVDLWSIGVILYGLYLYVIK